MISILTLPVPLRNRIHFKQTTAVHNMSVSLKYETTRVESNTFSALPHVTTANDIQTRLNVSVTLNNEAIDVLQYTYMYCTP